MRRKYLAITILLLAATVSVIGKLFFHSGHKTKLTVIYTDSLYGKIFPQYVNSGIYQKQYIGGISKIASVINDLKQEIENMGDEHIILDAGSSLFSGDSTVDFEVGHVVVQAMNYIGYDAMGLGDVDLNIPADKMLQIVKEAHFPMLSINVKASAPLQEIYSIKPYKIFQKNQLKIAVIGISNPNMYKICGQENLKGLTFEKYQNHLKNELEKIKKQNVNIIIALSDLFNPEEEASVIKQFKDIDIMVSTTPFSFNKSYINEVEGRHLLKTPRLLKHIGKYEITYDHQQSKIVKTKWQLFPAITYRENDEMLRLISEHRYKINNISLEYPIAKSLLFMPYETVREGLFGNLVADILVEKTNADVAFINSANLLDLPHGVITLGSLMKSIPYNGKVLSMDLSGRQIKDILETSFEQLPNIGVLQLSGMRVSYDLNRSKKNKVFNIEVRGKPLQLNKIYRVTTTEFLWNGGDNFSQFSAGKNIKTIDQKLRPLVTSVFKERKEISSKIDNRMMDLTKNLERNIACVDCNKNPAMETAIEIVNDN